jgi:hypothetical protein
MKMTNLQSGLLFTAALDATIDVKADVKMGRGGGATEIWETSKLS